MPTEKALDHGLMTSIGVPRGPLTEPMSLPAGYLWASFGRWQSGAELHYALYRHDLDGDVVWSVMARERYIPGYPSLGHDVIRSLVTDMLKTSELGFHYRHAHYGVPQGHVLEALHCTCFAQEDRYYGSTHVFPVFAVPK